MGNRYEQEKLLKQANTLYVGNLSFYTTEEQVYELFSKSGDVKRIIIGLDKVKKTACGFCFVEYPFFFYLWMLCFGSTFNPIPIHLGLPDPD
ncbi:unnamed protein product [Coregonus sp. 'balchen']|nr:unnamed protein product [Coregonus sp. 'balchen']